MNIKIFILLSTSEIADKAHDIRKEKSKVVKKMLIALLILVVLAVGWIIFSVERNKGKNLSIGAINFNKLNSGSYTGDYAGGMLKMRANEVQVTVTSSKVSDIKLIKNTAGRPAEFTNKLFSRVIDAQTLQVDTISGATICSKAYLKAIEDALCKAESK